MTASGDMAQEQMKAQTRISKFAICCALFVGLNLAFAMSFNFQGLDIFPLQNRTEVWWTVKNFRELRDRADLLLIGSSLMCRIINEGDATRAHKVFNGHTHYCSQNLEDALDKELHTKIKTVSLAVPGLNASDASVVGCELLKGQKKPALIVYGIAPRDLMDNALTNPAGTDVFHLLEKIGDLSDVAYTARTTREDQFKFAVNQLLSRALPIYKCQEELAVAFRRQASGLLEKYVPMPATCLLPPLDRQTRVVLHLLASDEEANLRIFPFDPECRDHSDCRNNYLYSYNPFKPRQYRMQLYFVDRFLRIAQERGMKVVLVNMPLRQDSFDLMPMNFYNLYSQDIRRLAATRGATLIDMQCMAFKDDDFDDQVHLTGLGACKFIERLAPRLANVVNGTVVARSAHRPVDLSTTSTRTVF
jgi:hypothetical protein